MVLGLQGQLELERLSWWPVVLALVVAGVVLSGWGYSLWRASDRRLESKWKVGVLWGVRVMSLGLMGVIALGPVWKRPARADEEGGLVVMLDTSQSMSVVDWQRTTAERLRLAESLGMWRDPLAGEVRRVERYLEELEQTTERMARLREEVDALEVTRRDPREAQERLTAARAELGRLRMLGVGGGSVEGGMRLPGGASGALERIDVETPEAGSRVWQVEVLRRVSEARQVIGSARDERRVQLARTDGATSSAAALVGGMDRLDIARELLTHPSRGLLRGGDRPGGSLARTHVRMYAFDRTQREIRVGDLGRLPEELKVLEGMGTATDYVGALERLLSSERTPRAVLLLTDGRQTVGSRRVSEDVPVFALDVSGEGSPPVVTFRSVEVPGVLATGQVGRVRARVGSSSSNTDQGMTIRMLASGQTQVRQVNVVGDRPVEVEFDVLADRAGGMVVELTLEPRGGGDVGVTGGVVGTGMSGGGVLQPTQRLRRVIQVTSDQTRVLFVAGGVQTWDAQGLREQLVATPGVRLAVARVGGEDLVGQIRRADTVVVAGVSPSELSSESRHELTELMVRRGGSVLMLSDTRFIPSAWLEDSELSGLIPSARGGWRSSQGAEGTYFGVPAPGRMEMGSVSDWAGRAPITRMFELGELKAGATALLVERETGKALLTGMRVGPGRVSLLTTDQGWRWQMGSNREPVASDQDLWARLVRLSVEGRYAETEGGVSLDAQVSGDGGLEVRVRRLERDGSPGRGVEQPVVAVRFEGRTIRTVETSETLPGRYQARVPGLEPGEYTLGLVGLETPRMALIVGDSGQSEMSDLTGDRAGLQRFCQATGGGVYGPTETDALVRRLNQAMLRPGEMVRSRLWDAPPTLLLLLSLLAAEWALRKHWGMA